jgi:hypothetical protein
MPHESELGLRSERTPGDEAQILGKKMETFWSFLDALHFSVTGYVKMHENRRFENEVSTKRDEASPASIMIDANDTQARAVYDSIWPLMRKLLPSMTTISA